MQADFYIDSYNFMEENRKELPESDLCWADKKIFEVCHKVDGLMETDFSFSFEVDLADGKSSLIFCKTLQKELEEHSVPIKNER